MLSAFPGTRQNNHLCIGTRLRHFAAAVKLVLLRVSAKKHIRRDTSHFRQKDKHKGADLRLGSRLFWPYQLPGKNKYAYQMQ